MQVFERYIAYYDIVETTDKNELINAFKAFLDDPYSQGTFCVRFKEDSGLYNTESALEHIQTAINYHNKETV